jgi:hypothetical protein
MSAAHERAIVGESDLRYAIAWRAEDGPEAVGNLVIRDTALLLRGNGADGRRMSARIPLDCIGTVRIGRSVADRVRGERSVVIELMDGESIAVAPLSQGGAVFELADLLVELGSRTQERQMSRVVVVVPIRAGAAARARELVGDGPPFDLEDAELERHEVFVTDREVVFLFEGARVRDAVERLLRRPAVLRAATSWRAVLDGRPRLGEESYSWRRSGGRDAPSRE